MRIKPVSNWLLLGESLIAEEQMVGTLIIPDTTKSTTTLTAAKILAIGPLVGIDPETKEETTPYAVGETILFRDDSPSLMRMMEGGIRYLLLPEPHVVAKWVTADAEA